MAPRKTSVRWKICPHPQTKPSLPLKDLGNKGPRRRSSETGGDGLWMRSKKIEERSNKGYNLGIRVEECGVSGKDKEEIHGPNSIPVFISSSWVEFPHFWSELLNKQHLSRIRRSCPMLQQRSYRKASSSRKCPHHHHQKTIVCSITMLAFAFVFCFHSWIKAGNLANISVTHRVFRRETTEKKKMGTDEEFVPPLLLLPYLKGHTWG